jgi:cell division septation protein DedD
MEETSLLHEPSIDNEIIKALMGFSIVESAIKTRNSLVIKVDNEQWVKADKVQRNVFIKTVHGFVNANIAVEAIYIKNNQWKSLACLQKGATGNNYMVLADTVKEKLETEKDKEAPFSLEKALSAEDTHVQNMAAVYAESAQKPVSDFMDKSDIPDISVKEFAPEQTSQPVMHKNPGYEVLYKILIVFLVVFLVGEVGYYLYYFLIKERAQAKQWSFVLPTKIVPLRVPQEEIDKKIRVPITGVQIQKATDNGQTELGKKDASHPAAAPALLPGSQTAAPPAHKEGTPSQAIKENKHVEPAPAVAPIGEKPAQPPAEEKRVIAPPQQEASVNATMYCVNVASCKFKESADAVIKDLQKKGYESASDTITVKDTTWYRVTLGHFQTQGEARNYARELQSRENIKGLVVKKK